MSSATAVLEHALVYRLWQAPFAEQKFRPVRRHNDLDRVRRVLDVGCGPGTNAGHFDHARYLGIDLNPRYVDAARQRYGPNFRVADVVTDAFEAGNFDFILANSLIHHLSDTSAERLLGKLVDLLTVDGHVHVLDLVLPQERGLGRWLARNDRGAFARPLGEWEALFARYFEPVVFEPFTIGAGGLRLWNMVYFKGRRRPVV